MAFRGRLTGWERGGGWVVEGRQGRWGRPHTRAQAPIPASLESRGGARGNTWLVGRLPGAGVTEETPAARGPHRRHPATAQRPLVAAPPRFPRQPLDTNTEARHPPHAGNGTRLPGPDRRAGGHCVPGGDGAILPQETSPPLPQAPPPRPGPGPGRGSGEGAPPAPSTPRGRFHPSLPREAPGCARGSLRAAPHRPQGRNFPSDTGSPQQGRAWGCSGKSAFSPKRPPNLGASAWREGGGAGRGIAQALL